MCSSYPEQILYILNEFLKNNKFIFCMGKVFIFCNNMIEMNILNKKYREIDSVDDLILITTV